MKKKSIITVFVCCLLYCVTAFANNMTIEDFVGVDSADKITMVYIECGNYGIEFPIVEKNEIQEMYQALMDMPIEQSMPKSDYFKMNQHTNLNDNIHSKRSFYDVKIYMDQRGKGLIVDKQFTVSVDKIYHDDWVFASGSSDIGKENEFYKYITEKAKTKQKYFFELEKSDMYQNHVFVENEKLSYEWGKPYFNKNNQLMVPFKELKTALGVPSSTYHTKEQTITIRKNDPVPLYGEVIDDVIYVPVRTFAEMLKYHIYWDNDLKTVLITENDNIELWNRRNIYAPQSRIVTEEYTLNLPENISHEVSGLNDDTIYFCDYKNDVTLGYIKKYMNVDEGFDFQKDYENNQLGSIADNFLSILGIRLHDKENKFQMTGGDSNYADYEMWVGSEESSSTDYYFFVNGKNIYVIAFDERQINRAEQEKIVSTFEYR